MEFQRAGSNGRVPKKKFLKGVEFFRRRFKEGDSKTRVSKMEFLRVGSDKEELRKRSY